MYRVGRAPVLRPCGAIRREMHRFPDHGGIPAGVKVQRPLHRTPPALKPSRKDRGYKDNPQGVGGGSGTANRSHSGPACPPRDPRRLLGPLGYRRFFGDPFCPMAGPIAELPVSYLTSFNINLK